MAISKESRKKVWDKTQGKCWYCGCLLFEREPSEANLPDTFTVDHIIPKGKKGTNDLGNLIPCCRKCNTLKQDKTSEFLRNALTKQNSIFFTAEQRIWLELKGFNIELIEKELDFKFYFEHNKSNLPVDYKLTRLAIKLDKERNSKKGRAVTKRKNLKRDKNKFKNKYGLL